VADDNSFLGTEGANDASYIAGECGDVVTGRWFVRCASSPQVESRNPKTSFGKSWDLRAPSPPELGKSMQQND